MTTLKMMQDALSSLPDALHVVSAINRYIDGVDDLVDSVTSWSWMYGVAKNRFLQLSM